MSLALSLKAAKAAHDKGHFAFAGDLLTGLLATDLSASDRSDTCTALAAAKRSNGHLRDAVLAAQQAQDEVGLVLCSCDAHYEEGAAWQELDCAERAAACFERALAKDPSHEPSKIGAA